MAGNDDALADGLFVDEFVITAGTTVVFSDGAETLAPGWSATGWARVEAVLTTLHNHYYIAGWRTYTSYDRYLRTGPYYFGYADTRPDLVDHYGYQQGLLVSYWDTTQGDNNVSTHAGLGRNLYVDSRPATLYRMDGAPWRTRVQIYDAPFSPWKADSFTLHHESQPAYIRGPNGRPLFDDTADYFDENLPNHGVTLPAVGVRIRVVEPQGTSVKLRVS